MQKRRRFPVSWRPLALLLLWMSQPLLLGACLRPQYELELLTPTVATVTSQASTTVETSPPSTVLTEPSETDFVPDLSLEDPPQGVESLQAVPKRYRQAYGVNTDSPRMQRMQAKLDAFLAEAGLAEAKLSVVYQDLGSMERMDYQGMHRYRAASVIKLPMAMVCRQFQAEGIFKDPMEVLYLPGEQFTAADQREEDFAKPMALDRLLQDALRYSNNAATSVLFAYFQRHGRDLHFFMDERCGTNYAKDVSMSPVEGIQLLESLYFDQGNYPAYQGLLEEMAQNSWNSFLKGAMPVSVSSKYGQIAQQSHEVGLVWAERPFAYAVFSDGLDAFQVLPAIGRFLWEAHQGE